MRLQSEFSHINTNDPDLADFSAAGGKMVMYQGLADEYIPAQGAIHYYEQVMTEMGGAEAVHPFFRFYLIPGFTHSGRSEGGPAVPVPQPATGRDEMFSALQSWVEKGDAPERLELLSADETVTLPTCVYPNEITYRGSGPATSTGSYYCDD